MKTILPLIFALLYCFPTSQAQYFARKDSKWVYLDYGWMFDNYVEISYTRDTIFEGRSCMEFTGNYIRIDKWSGDTLYGNAPGMLYLTEEDGLVEYNTKAYYMPGWDTLFNFNGTLGSQWEVGIGWVHPLEQLTISLRDTFTTQINGKDLKALVIGYTKSPSNPNYLLDTVITYIGNKNLFILPGSRIVRGGDTQFGGPIKCFFNNTLGGIQMRAENIPGYDYDCDQLVKSTDLHNYEKDFILSPNPAEDELNISSPSEKIMLLEVFDLYGNLVEKKANLNTIEARLSISHLSKGIYFVRVNDLSAKRFIKM